MTDVIEYSPNREYLGQDAVTTAVLTVLSYVFTCMFYIVEAVFYVLDAGFFLAQTSQVRSHWSSAYALYVVLLCIIGRIPLGR
jgi:uncharacterized membrane protein